MLHRVNWQIIMTLLRVVVP